MFGRILVTALIASLLATAVLIVPAAATGQQIQYDVILRGGTVLDKDR